jgi:L-threonylcarbamoyladenylate synthase
MTLRLKIDPNRPAAGALSEALAILRGGGVVAYPTETFYGLGADARREEAVEKIFRIKGRDFRNPVALIVENERDLIPLVEEPSPAGLVLIKAFWPGPLTLLFRASPAVLPKLTASTGKIGIRVSSHPVARLLAGGLPGPLTATSANRTGGPECTSADAVLDALGNSLDAVIDGGMTPGGPGSTILDITVTPPLILREGAIPGIRIRAVLEHGK